MRWFSILVAVVVPALVACGPSSFEGTINGMTLSVKESVFLRQKDSSGNLVGLELQMTDRPGLCDVLKAEKTPSDSTLLIITFRQTNNATVDIPPTTGDYNVGGGIPSPNKTALVVLIRRNATCMNTAVAVGAMGIATLKENGEGLFSAITGTFDMTFVPGEEQASGTFDADFCDATGGTSGCQ